MITKRKIGDYHPVYRIIAKEHVLNGHTAISPCRFKGRAIFTPVSLYLSETTKNPPGIMRLSRLDVRLVGRVKVRGVRVQNRKQLRFGDRVLESRHLGDILIRKIGAVTEFHSADKNSRYVLVKWGDGSTSFAHLSTLFIIA